jgi:polysaccharide biosynthesis/export protein
MRKPIALLTAFALSACAQTWEENPPQAAPGGAGIMADGQLAEGPGAISSINKVPAYTASGIRAPFGSDGEAAAYEHQSGYKVGAGDRLTIRVLGETELTNDYLVDGSGHISMPYVQSLDVGGRTTPVIEKQIAQRLRQGYLRNPQVSVQVTTLRPFFILGEVSAAGGFAYQPGMTAQNAIAIAGGYSARADQGKVLVTRKNANGTATFKVPVTTQIYPGDIIYVRERWF